MLCAVTCCVKGDVRRCNVQVFNIAAAPASQYQRRDANDWRSILQSTWCNSPVQRRAGTCSVEGRLLLSVITVSVLSVMVLTLRLYSPVQRRAGTCSVEGWLLLSVITVSVLSVMVLRLLLYSPVQRRAGTRSVKGRLLLSVITVSVLSVMVLRLLLCDCLGDICRHRTTSMEQSVAQSQTMWAVIRPVQAVTETVRPRCSLNCFWLHRMAIFLFKWCDATS